MINVKERMTLLLPFLGGLVGRRRGPPSQWAEMFRKVYEVDPLLSPQCGDTMKVIAS